jgi:hypothetical protein
LNAISQAKNVHIIALLPSYISHLEDKGIDLAVIQALSVQSTQAAAISYIHVQSPSRAAAMDSIDTLLTGENNVVGTQEEFRKIKKYKILVISHASRVIVVTRRRLELRTPSILIIAQF